MKQMMNKFSILTIVLIIGIGIMAACTASENATNDKASAGGAEQTKSTADNKTTDDKFAKNKPSENEKAKPVEIADGREVNNRSEVTQTAEKSFVEKEVRPKEAVIKKLAEMEDYEYASDAFSVSSVVEGSFTKPNSKQKAYLYTLSISDEMKYPPQIDGIIIAEDGKVISHYVKQGVRGSYDSLKTLPDINQNGLDELVLNPSNSINFDKFQKSVEIYEAADGLINLGSFLTFTYDNSSDVSNAGVAIAYKISVEGGKKPIFYRETYEQKSDKDKWQLKKKPETVSPEMFENLNELFKQLQP